MDKLNNDHMIAIRYNKGNSVADLPDYGPIPYRFQKVILDHIEKGYGYPSEEGKLSKAAKEYLPKLLAETGFIRKEGKGIMVDKYSHGKHQKRLTLIEAEIEAGNNNQSLIREADYILHQMFDNGKITLKSYKDHIKQLRKFNKK
jgi:hypothetical protein